MAVRRERVHSLKARALVALVAWRLAGVQDAHEAVGDHAADLLPASLDIVTRAPRSSRSRHGPARCSGAPKPARGQALALPLSEANQAQEASA